LLLSRVDRLPADARRLLQEAAVLGAEFDESLLRAVASDAATAHVALDRLVEADVIQSAGSGRDGARYRFTHALAHEVVYQNVLIARRTELHQTAGRALERIAGPHPERLSDLEALGHHWSLSADKPRGARYLLAAGDWARQYDLAISQFLNLADDPGLAVVYIAKGKFLLAITALQEDIGRRGRRSVSLALLATAYGFSGQTEKARRLISELHKIAQHDYVSPFIFIGPYLSLGDREKSLDWVERSYESQDPWTVFFKTLPGCDPLRAEPRFQAILRRMNFPQ
jgi:tetratricopeptide (TPR) repeat protein